MAPRRKFHPPGRSARSAALNFGNSLRSDSPKFLTRAFGRSPEIFEGDNEREARLQLPLTTPPGTPPKIGGEAEELLAYESLDSPPWLRRGARRAGVVCPGKSIVAGAVVASGRILSPDLQ